MSEELKDASIALPKAMLYVETAQRDINPDVC